MAIFTINSSGQAEGATFSFLTSVLNSTDDSVVDVTFASAADRNAFLSEVVPGAVFEDGEITGDPVVALGSYRVNLTHTATDGTVTTGHIPQQATYTVSSGNTFPVAIDFIRGSSRTADWDPAFSGTGTRTLVVDGIVLGGRRQAVVYSEVDSAVNISYSFTGAGASAGFDNQGSEQDDDVELVNDENEMRFGNRAAGLYQQTGGEGTFSITGSRTGHGTSAQTGQRIIIAPVGDDRL